MAKRRKVVKICVHYISWCNAHEAELDCGHVTTVQMRKGKQPKTAMCSQCV